MPKTEPRSEPLPTAAVADALVRIGQRQVRFREYLERRAGDPNYTFRRHLGERGGAIET